MRRVGHRASAAFVVLCSLLAVSACTLPMPARSAATSASARQGPSASAPPSLTADPIPPPATAPAGSGSVIVLDPGHNGGNAAAPAQINRLVPAGGFSKPCNTTGTATETGYPEHRFTFDVAQRTAVLLRAAGMTVVLTRRNDAGVGPCVNERAAIANDAEADLAVSIHADGAAPSARGFHVIEPALAPDKGNAAILPASEKAATSLRSAFAAATGEAPATYPGALLQPGLTRRNDLAGLNLARVPAVFIECANMRNRNDAAALMDAAWRQRAAQGIADGVLSYLASR
jgi:N-acetylmuramoyl-L-alanine amidase